jgi:hypothetical protein
MTEYKKSTDVEDDILLLETFLIKKKEELKPLQKEIAQAQKEFDSLNKIITDMKKKESLNPDISDHAILRYLERVRGFSFDDVRKEILDDSAISSIEAGASKIKRNGFEMIIKDKKVVTII